MTFSGYSSKRLTYLEKDLQQNTTRDITFGTRWEQTPFTAWQTSANQLLSLIVYLDMPIYRLSCECIRRYYAGYWRVH